MRRMVASKLMAAAGLLAVGVAAPQLAAQTPGPAAAAAPGSSKLLANWSGTYVTDGPSGPMTLTIAKEAAVWRIQTSLEAAPPPGEVREIAAAGERISWKQTFGEYDVTFTATLSADGAQLAGTLEATQGGSAVGGGTFTLTKK